MKNIEELKDIYAKLCVTTGINLEIGQTLVISSSVEGAEFVRKVARHAYEAGAKEVHVNWNDGPLTKMKYTYAPMEVFEKFPKWYADGMVAYAKEGAGFLSLISQDPELLKDADTKKIAASNKSSSLAMKEFRKYTMNNLNSWCVAAIPGREWAQSLFSGEDENEAINKLWEAILRANRVDSVDPEKSWEEHMKSLSGKVEFLNKKSFDRLIYTSSKGTNLSVKLPKGHIWTGGGEYNSKKRFFIANMPTEEVFTLPDKYGVEGVVYGTKPLFYSGNMIDGFYFKFKDGRIVEFGADQGEDVLKDMLNIDEGARYLGEVALVPYDSPISNTNLLFKNTLFDENASCHFALGKAYPTCLKNGENLSEKELEEAGANDSLTHVDFMIGSKDMQIIGIDNNGDETIVFKDGNWAI
jgi:aminopeptidase